MAAAGWGQVLGLLGRKKGTHRSPCRIWESSALSAPQAGLVLIQGESVHLPKAAPSLHCQAPSDHQSLPTCPLPGSLHTETRRKGWRSPAALVVSPLALETLHPRRKLVLLLFCLADEETEAQRVSVTSQRSQCW